MLPRHAYLALLLISCSAGSDLPPSAAAHNGAVVEVPAVPAPTSRDRRADEGLRLVYRVEPSTNEAVEQALAAARERLDALGGTTQLALYREGLAIVLELGPSSEQQARAIGAAMVARSGLTMARLADEGDPLAALRKVSPPAGIMVDVESVPIGVGATNLVAYAHTSAEPNRHEASARLVSWVKSVVPRVERLALGWATIAGSDKLRTYVLAEEPHALELTDATVTDQGHGPAVAITLSSAGASAFLRKTRINVDRRLALLVAGEVKTAPRVMMPIGGGKLVITLGGVHEPAHEAADLARRLRMAAGRPTLELAREETFSTER